MPENFSTQSCHWIAGVCDGEETIRGYWFVLFEIWYRMSLVVCDMNLSTTTTFVAHPLLFTVVKYGVLATRMRFTLKNRIYLKNNIIMISFIWIFHYIFRESFFFLRLLPFSYPNLRIRGFSEEFTQTLKMKT